jgi:hypothetical protein
VRIHLSGEHALEFQLLDTARKALDIVDDGIRRLFVVFHLGELQQLAGAGQAFGQRADAGDGFVQQRAFATERLGPLRVVPDVGAFQLAIDFFQTLYFRVVVKDTPSAHPADP